jgi:hypothetical protein
VHAKSKADFCSSHLFHSIFHSATKGAERMTRTMDTIKSVRVFSAISRVFDLLNLCAVAFRVDLFRPLAKHFGDGGGTCVGQGPSPLVRMASFVLLTQINILTSIAFRFVRSLALLLLLIPNMRLRHPLS